MEWTTDINEQHFTPTNEFSTHVGGFQVGATDYTANEKRFFLLEPWWCLICKSKVYYESHNNNNKTKRKLQQTVSWPDVWCSLLKEVRIWMKINGFIRRLIYILIHKTTPKWHTTCCIFYSISIIFIYVLIKFSWIMSVFCTDITLWFKLYFNALT